MTASARFRRADRVVAARDYARVRRCGRRLTSRNFVISVAPVSPVAGRSDPSSSSISQSGCIPTRGGSGHPTGTRLGMAVSRRVGNAVVRNRVKRAIREWFRSSRERVPNNVDIVVIAQQGAALRGTAEIARELDKLFKERRSETKSGVRK